MSDKMIYKKFYFENYKGIKDKLEVEIDANSQKPIVLLVIMKVVKQQY